MQKEKRGREEGSRQRRRSQAPLCLPLDEGREEMRSEREALAARVTQPDVLSIQEPRVPLSRASVLPVISVTRPLVVPLPPLCAQPAYVCSPRVWMFAVLPVYSLPPSLSPSLPLLSPLVECLPEAVASLDQRLCVSAVAADQTGRERRRTSGHWCCCGTRLALSSPSFASRHLASSSLRDTASHSLCDMHIPALATD